MGRSDKAGGGFEMAGVLMVSSFVAILQQIRSHGDSLLGSSLLSSIGESSCLPADTNYGSIQYTGHVIGMNGFSANLTYLSAASMSTSSCSIDQPLLKGISRSTALNNCSYRSRFIQIFLSRDKFLHHSLLRSEKAVMTI